MSDRSLILIVDGAGDGTQAMRLALERGGLETDVASDEEQAVERLRTRTPELVILKTRRAIEEESLLCREIKEGKRKWNIPVIVIAEASGIDTAANAFERGAADFLAAPFSVDELTARVGIHLDHARQKRLLEEKNRQLERAQQQLSGLAQMATSVLHNVGNVINSLNISADLAAGHVQNLQLSALSKLADMLSSHPDMRGDASWEERVKKIPNYLRILSETYDNRRDAGLKELAALREKMEHVKAIISMQQGYARGAGTPEAVKVIRLAEDAIELNAGHLAESVEIERDILNDFQIRVDKNRAVLILVNLLRNARQSCAKSARPDKRIRIRLDTRHAGYAVIHVIDNGTGVTPEHLSRLFDYGFTTKADGHGFGLHSSRKTAEDLGGSLTLASTTPGEGADFALTLPREPKPAELAYDI